MTQCYWKAWQETSTKLILPFGKLILTFSSNGHCCSHEISINQHCLLLKVFSDSYVLLRPKDIKSAGKILIVTAATFIQKVFLSYCYFCYMLFRTFLHKTSVFLQNPTSFIHPLSSEVPSVVNFII